jgi:hypothetical protein
MARVEDEPAFAEPQSMLYRIEVQAHALQQIPILNRSLLDEGVTFGHSRPSVLTVTGQAAPRRQPDTTLNTTFKRP